MSKRNDVGITSYFKREYFNKKKSLLDGEAFAT